MAPMLGNEDPSPSGDGEQSAAVQPAERMRAGSSLVGCVPPVGGSSQSRWERGNPGSVPGFILEAEPRGPAGVGPQRGSTRSQLAVMTSQGLSGPLGPPLGLMTHGTQLRCYPQGSGLLQ